MPLVIDSQFNWGPVRTGVEQMRSFVQQSTKGIQSDIAGMFTPAGLSGLLSVGFIEQGITKIVEYGARIADLGKRFAVSTTDLQQFGNVAERSGSSLDSVAMAFNRADIARSKALGGNKQMIESWKNLNVTADDLKNLSLPELFLKIGASSMNAADMVKILGKNGTELRETLRNLADGTEELSAAIDPKHIAALKKADDAWKKWGQGLKIWVAEEVGEDVKTLERFGNVLEHLKNIFSAPFDAQAWKDSLAFLTAGKLGERAKPLGPTLDEMRRPAGAGSAVTGAEDIDEVSRRAGGGSGSVAGLADKIAKLEEEHMARNLSDQEKLNALLEKSHELYYAQAAASGDENEVLKARQAYLENEKAIDEVSAKMAKDLLDTDAKRVAEREKLGAEADQALEKSKANKAVLDAELRGAHELAEVLKLEAEYDDKIAKATAAWGVAVDKGYDEVADTNRELVGQLQTEKQLAVAAKEKAQAEKAAAEAAALHAQDLKEAAQVRAQEIPQAQQTLTDLEEQRKENDQIAFGHADIAAKMHEEWEWQRKINDATAAANDAWEKMNEAYAEGKTLLGDQYAELAKINEATTRELELQKQISEQRRQQVVWAKGMQDLANNLSGYSIDQLAPKVGTSGLRASPGDPATTMATNPYTGQIDENQLAYWQKYFQTHGIGGLVAQQLAGRQKQFSAPGGFANAGATQPNYSAAPGAPEPILPSLNTAVGLLKSIDKRLTPVAGSTSRG